MGKVGNKGRKQGRQDALRRAEKEQELLEATRTPAPEQPIIESHLISPQEEIELSYPSSPSDIQHRITLIKDHTLEYPDLFMEIHLVGQDGDSDSLFAQFFARAQCKKAKSIDTADLVVFVGGSDVNPALYGEECHEKTHFSDTRDTADITDYLHCMNNGIPMLGVCRGAQFLHVMNGGKLYQHVDNHYGHHPMLDIVTKVQLERVSSVHHQMVIPNTEMKILATSARARNRWINPKNNVIGPRADVEAFFYPNTCCLGIQGHPEYRGFSYFSVWALNLIQKYVVENNDLDWAEEGKVRRLKPELLTERSAGVMATISKGVN